MDQKPTEIIITIPTRQIIKATLIVTATQAVVTVILGRYVNPFLKKTLNRLNEANEKLKTENWTKS